MTDRKLNVIGQDNVVLAAFLSNYLETSSGLAESAIDGLMDFCTEFGITEMALGDERETRPSEEWWEAQRFLKERLGA